MPGYPHCSNKDGPPTEAVCNKVAISNSDHSLWDGNTIRSLVLKPFQIATWKDYGM